MPPPVAIPPAKVLTVAPHIPVARVALGLTLYLAEPVIWARERAAAFFDAFRARAFRGASGWYTTSQLADWFRLDGNRLDEISRGLSRFLGRPRNLLQVRVVDHTGAPALSFNYREIDPRLTQRAATLEVAIPPDSDPALLLDLAAEAATLGPLLCGVGGFVASWNPHEKPTAFWEIHAWCKRYLGLDVQDADAMAFCVLEGLPGSNWLTLVGPALADRLKLDLRALEAGPWGAGIEPRMLPHALLLRAGDAPTLGDL
ncbi:MAG: hypothetical protein ACJ79G_13800, partial [Myxococcales bacterium]